VTLHNPSFPFVIACGTQLLNDPETATFDPVGASRLNFTDFVVVNPTRGFALVAGGIARRLAVDFGFMTPDFFFVAFNDLDFFAGTVTFRGFTVFSTFLADGGFEPFVGLATLSNLTRRPVTVVLVIGLAAARFLGMERLL
jgi:hypothetical protein